VQKASQLDRFPLTFFKDPIQRLAAKIHEYQHRSSVVTSDLQRTGCPRRIKFGSEREFVLDPPKSLR
jgi:hypothetical protein